MADLTLQAINKSFGTTKVLKGIDLDIKDHEFIVFVGPSGCGKSTLLRIIAGLEDQTSGEIEIDGANVSLLPPAKRGIAMVFQSYALYPHMNVERNMGFGLRQARAPLAEIKSKVADAARILQLEPLLRRKPRELSGGQRQRVAIGRAIVRNPKVFLFDEPLSNLDAALRVQMRVEIARLHHDLNATMIYVTHDQVEAMTLADRIVVMNHGVVEQVGSPLELYHNPNNLFVAGFIGSPKMNFVACTATEIGEQGVTVSLPGDATITVPVVPEGISVGASLTLGIRPEHGLLGERGGDAVLSGTALVVERLGGMTDVHIGGVGDGMIVLQAIGEPDVDVDDTLSISLPANQCHLFDGDGNALIKLNPWQPRAARKAAA